MPLVSFAQVVINEIMYDLSGSDTDREWVEIYNKGAESVTINTGSGNNSWRFIDNSTHILNLINGDATLSPSQYAIIAKNADQFLSEWPSFSGVLFTSSMSLSNTGATLSLRDGNGVTLNTFSYSSDQGASGDGNSLQLQTDGTWKAVSPTPGAINADVNNNSNTQNLSNNNTSGEVLAASTTESSLGGGSTTNVSSLNAQLEVIAGNDRTTSPGSPIWFQATVKKNTTSINPELNWSFGDGNVGVGPLVDHTYKYPGNYVVVLSAKAGDIFSVSRLKVKVTESNTSVSDKDEYLEISNNGNTEINLFNWKVENKGKGFIFQPNTILLPRSSIKLDKSLLTMKGYDNSLGTCLKNSLGEEIFAVAPIKEVNLSEASKNLEIIKQEFSAVQEKAKNLNLISQNNNPNLQANVVLAVAVNKNKEEQVATGTENVIYEVPKKENFLGRAWKFLVSLFD